MDPDLDPDPELGKFEAGSGSGINSFGSNTLHRSKTEFMLGPGSYVNVSSHTILFVDLPYTIIHASRAQFSSPPGSGVNLTPEPGNILLIALFNKRTSFSEDFNFRQSRTCLQNLPKCKNRLFISSNSRHPPLWEVLKWQGWGRGMSVSEVDLTPELGPSVNSVLL